MESPTKKRCLGLTRQNTDFMGRQHTGMLPSMVPSLRLNTGFEIPACGLGTWNGDGVKAAVLHALECGYRHLDCAAIYGNEVLIGEALKETEVPRDQIFVTSKLWNTEHAPEDVENAARKTLTDLGIDYLDLYLMHWPVSMKKGAPMPPGPHDFVDVALEDTWSAMEKLVEKGLVRSIGVSNFSVAKLEHILKSGKIKPAVNQVEGHPYLQQPALKAFCDTHNIIVTAYSPLGSPERPARVKDEGDPVLLEDPTLADIAKSVDRTPAEVLIRWAVQRGTVVIPKSVTPSRIEANLRAAVGSPLTASEMTALEQMDKGLRLLKGAGFAPEGTNGSIKSVAQLWDEETASKL